MQIKFRRSLDTVHTPQCVSRLCVREFQRNVVVNVSEVFCGAGRVVLGAALVSPEVDMLP